MKLLSKEEIKVLLGHNDSSDGLEECSECGDDPRQNTGEEFCYNCRIGNSWYLDQ